MDNTRARKFLKSKIKLLKAGAEAMQGNDLFGDDKNMRILIADIRESCEGWERFMTVEAEDGQMAAVAPDKPVPPPNITFKEGQERPPPHSKK